VFVSSCPVSPSQGRRSSTAALLRRLPSRAGVAAPGRRCCTRGPLAVVLVPSPSRLEHPSSTSLLRRRAAALRRRVSALPPALSRCSRSLEIGTVDCPTSGPDRAMPLVRPAHTGQPSLITRSRSWPLDLDPMDQIQPLSLNRAFLFKKP
jgi:hypothetical protein